MGWHDRVGNGNQLQNVGLVLLAALANLRIRDKAPENLLFIEPPSEPDGLSVVDGVYILKVGHLDIPVGGDKVFAYKIPQAASRALNQKDSIWNLLKDKCPCICRYTRIKKYVYIYIYI